MDDNGIYGGGRGCGGPSRNVAVADGIEISHRFTRVDDSPTNDVYRAIRRFSAPRYARFGINTVLC